MKNINIILVLLLIVFITIIISFTSNYMTKEHNLKKYYQDLNKSKYRDTISVNALPLIEDNSKYIELQTKEWIKQREEKGYCYGLLEKDKIIMMKWLEKFKINCPKIYYYDYHTNFTYDKLKNIALNNPEKKLIVKISHLQSSYGIIIMPAYKEQKNENYLTTIYNKCLEKFKTCFVCNHDKNDAPLSKEIKNNIKTSYYKLYETIEPGVIIQEYFESYKNKSDYKPLELKILVYGDKIIGGVVADNLERYELVYQMARDVSKKLGSSLIRVDIFIKETDNPYIPYLNEISLSPNGGFKCKYLDKDTIRKIKNEVKNYKPIKMEIDELIKSSPKRTIPIERYLSDSEWSNWWKEKYKLGLLK